MCVKSKVIRGGRCITSAAVVAGLAGTARAQLTDSFPAVFELSSLLPENGGDGTNGIVINGIGPRSFSGRSVSSAGDVNGDGVDDLIIGAYFADPGQRRNAGETYVVFGSAGSVFGASLDLSSLDGTNGFVVNGIDPYDYSGRSVSSAGDVNGDGVDDIIIGASQASPNGIPSAGESYIVFGRMDGTFAAVLDLATLNGSSGVVFAGVSGSDRSGSAVSSAGDINGDGIDDFIIGAYLADVGANRTDANDRWDAGETYVVFGSAAIGTTALLQLSALDGTNGFVVNGIAADDFSGIAASSAGDVNGDGVDDIVIGASGANQTYVIFGRAGGTVSASLEPSSLDGTNGFVINGIDAYDRSGMSVASAGDLNADGVGDLIIGGDRADPKQRLKAGETHVVFGRAGGGFNASLDLATLDGTNGFVINGGDSYDFSGRSVSSAGDVNGDGIDDLIIGASAADPSGRSYAGKSYVVFGRAISEFAPSLNLTSLDGTNGFVINGIDTGDQSGCSVASAGDVNGDGVDDLVIGAFGGDPNGISIAGETYVVFGRRVPQSCNTADLSVEFGTLDINDILVFATAFNANDPIADLSPEFATFDINDILVFASAFNAGCP